MNENGNSNIESPKNQYDIEMPFIETPYIPYNPEEDIVRKNCSPTAFVIDIPIHDILMDY